MAARKMRGRREARDITLENYSCTTERPSPFLSSQGSSKPHLLPRANSEETSFTTCTSLPTSEGAEIIGATACSQSDQINFISGNPFVEVTKGILHLFKEE